MRLGRIRDLVIGVEKLVATSCRGDRGEAREGEHVTTGGASHGGAVTGHLPPPNICPQAPVPRKIPGLGLSPGAYVRDGSFRGSRCLGSGWQMSPFYRTTGVAVVTVGLRGRCRLSSGWTPLVGRCLAVVRNETFLFVLN